MRPFLSKRAKAVPFRKGFFLAAARTGKDSGASEQKARQAPCHGQSEHLGLRGGGDHTKPTKGPDQRGCSFCVYQTNSSP